MDPNPALGVFAAFGISCKIGGLGIKDPDLQSRF